MMAYNDFGYVMFAVARRRQIWVKNNGTVNPVLYDVKSYSFLNPFIIYPTTIYLIKKYTSHTGTNPIAKAKGISNRGSTIYPSLAINKMKPMPASIDNTIVNLRNPFFKDIFSPLNK